MITTEPKVSATARYTVRETAELLKLSKRTIYRYIEEGVMISQTRKLNGKQFITGLEITKRWNATW